MATTFCGVKRTRTAVTEQTQEICIFCGSKEHRNRPTYNPEVPEVLERVATVSLEG